MSTNRITTLIIVSAILIITIGCAAPKKLICGCPYAGSYQRTYTTTFGKWEPQGLKTHRYGRNMHENTTVDINKCLELIDGDTYENTYREKTQTGRVYLR